MKKYLLFIIFLLPTCLQAQKSLFLDTKPDWVNLGNIDVSGNKITVEALISSPTGTGGNIVSKHRAPANVNYLLRDFHFCITNTSKNFFELKSNFSFQKNVCYHVAGTYDGSTMRYYVNGCEVASMPANGNLFQNDFPTAIGNMSDVVQFEQFYGYIDEVRIWNVARSQTQIQQNMTDLINPASQAGLLAYYKFEGDYINSQGNTARNGTPVGSPVLQVNPICSPPSLLNFTTTITQPACGGASTGSVVINADGGIVPYTYSKDGITFQSSNIISGLPPANYTLYVKSNASCITSKNITINPASVMSFTPTQTNNTCYGANNGTASANLPSGKAPYTYTWQPNQGSTNSVSGLSSGIYSLTISDANGCTATHSFTITEPKKIITSATPLHISCFGVCDGEAKVNTVAGGNSPFSFSWSTSLGNTSDKITNQCVGTYSVTVTDATGCMDIESVVLTQPNELKIDAIIQNSVSCNGLADGTATVNASGGTLPPNYSYKWDFNAQTTQTAIGLKAGNYSVTVTDIVSGCEITGSTVITEPSKLVIAISEDTVICIGGTATINSVVKGGTLPYTFAWTNPLWIGAGSHKDDPLIAQNYRVTVTDKNSCSETGVMHVDLYPPLTVVAQSGQTICEESSVGLNAAASGGIGTGYAYQWIDESGTNLSSNPSLKITPQGSNPAIVTYSILVSDACETPVANDKVIIDFYPKLPSDFLVKELGGCEPFTAEFENKSPVSMSCLWDFGDGTSDIKCSSVNHVYEEPGTYSVSLNIISNEGCLGIEKKVTLEAYPNPIANFNFNPNNSDVQNTKIHFYDQSIGEISKWSWRFMDNKNKDMVLGNIAEQNPIFDFSKKQVEKYIYHLKDTGLYPVKLFVISDKGCVDDTTHYVKIDGTYYFNIANAFTPNDDGINDFFFPIGVGIEPQDDFIFQIFNRYGTLIFESYSLDDPWDGTARILGETKKVKQDVYIWKLSFKDITVRAAKHSPITGRVSALISE